MELFTPVKCKEPDGKWNHNAKFSSVGSCFSEHIAARLKRYRFDVLSNPNGIVFHPEPIAKCLRNLFTNKPTHQSDLVESNIGWISLQHHGSFRDSDPTHLVGKINSSQSEFRQHLCSSDVLFITWGTAWGYQYAPTQEMVANCHKLPAAQFTKVLTEPEDMFNLWFEVLSDWLKTNTKLHVVLTVSPVRHTREGLVENQRSKARLIELAHSLVDKMDRVNYFPSYEIMIDELRDYRFYERDMIHPNALAVDIIWERWVSSYLTMEANETMRLMEPWLLMADHRSINETTDETAKRHALADSEIQQLLLHKQ